MVPLIQNHELRTNKLGTATALIFFTCAVHHGSHAVHMFVPYYDIGTGPGLALRTAFDPWQAGWDVFAAVVGTYYWTLRRAYGRLLLPGKLFENYQQRQREASEVNDTIVQSLVTAQAAQRAGNDELLSRALASALDSAKTMVDRLLVEGSSDGRMRAGGFVRQRQAGIGDG